MRKVIAILFLLMYLFSTTQMAELLKLPVMVQHYTEHRGENRAITLLEFLDIHYMHGSPRDADYDRDMQLPFKMPVHSALASVVYIIPAAPAPVITPEMVFRETFQLPLTDSSGYSFNYLSAIWQPPRAC